MKILLLAVLLGAAYANWLDTATINDVYASADCSNCDPTIGKCLKMNSGITAECACFSGYRLDDTGACVQMPDCPNPSNGSAGWALSTEAPPSIILNGDNGPVPGAFSFVTIQGETNLRVGYVNEIRQPREWSLGNLVHSIDQDEVLTFHGPAPAKGQWKEDNSGCNERHVFQGLWSDLTDTAENSGFAGPDDTTEAGNDIYTTYAIVRERERAADFRGTIIYRHITHAFPLKIKLKNTVTVDDSVNVFSPVNVLAALTGSTILPVSPTRVEVTLTIQTDTQAPFYLTPVGGGDFDSTDLAIAPDSVGGVPSFTAPGAADITLTHVMNDDCDDEHTGTLAAFQAGQTNCGQTFTIQFQLDIVDANGNDQNCEADGLYKLYTRARCREELNPDYYNTLNANLPAGEPEIGCPIINPATTTEWDGEIDVNLDSANYCNQYEINVGLDGALGVFEEAARITPRDDFFLQTLIYFRAHLYSTDSNIQLNKVTLKTITVTGPVSGGSQILFPGAVDTQNSQCGNEWNLSIQNGSVDSLTSSTYTDDDGTTHNTISYDFDYEAMNEADVTYSVNGVPQTMTGLNTGCGMDIASDENKVLGTTVEFAVQYVGSPSSRTTHLTIGQGEEAALLSVARQAADGSDSASSQQATEFVVTVPRGEDNTQTPGAINTGSSKDAASTLSSFLF